MITEIKLYDIWMHNIQDVKVIVTSIQPVIIKCIASNVKQCKIDDTATDPLLSHWTYIENDIYNQFIQLINSKYNI